MHAPPASPWTLSSGWTKSAGPVGTLMGLARPPAVGVGRAVTTGGKAVGNYVSTLAGYGPNGPLTGQRLFDSTTVKPFLPPAAYKSRVAAGALPGDLAKTHQLPSWYHKAPVLGPVTRTATKAFNAADRQPLLHPLVQTGRTLSNLTSTPFTSPLINRVAPVLTGRGAGMVAGGRPLAGRTYQAAGYGLDGANRVLNATVKTVGLGSMGAAGAGAITDAWRSPARTAQDLVMQIPGYNQAYYMNRNNPEIESLRKNPLPAIWDGLTDPSDAAQINRAVGRRRAPYLMANAADKAIEQAETDPVFGAVDQVRRLNLVGQGTRALQSAIADPTPSPDATIVREEVARKLPDLLRNYDANVDSPTGRRFMRLLTPAAQNPRTAFAVGTDPYRNHLFPAIHDRNTAAARALGGVTRSGPPAIGDAAYQVNRARRDFFDPAYKFDPNMPTTEELTGVGRATGQIDLERDLRSTAARSAVAEIPPDVRDAAVTKLQAAVSPSGK